MRRWENFIMMSESPGLLEAFGSLGRRDQLAWRNAGDAGKCLRVDCFVEF